MKHKIILRFCIWGFDDISHEEISIRTGVNPIKTYTKGQKKNPNFSGLAKENGWIFQVSDNVYSPFEDQLGLLFDVINSKRTVFKTFCKKYTCEISCGVFIYFDNEESIPSVHLDSQAHKFLGDLNIAFDMDIYCLPDSEIAG